MLKFREIWILLYQKNEIKNLAVELSGEGKYNLNAIKEIKVTDSFLGLDMEDKGCQNEEPIEECTTRQYIDTVLHQCGCLPLKLTVTQKVELLIVSQSYDN